MEKDSFRGALKTTLQNSDYDEGHSRNKGKILLDPSTQKNMRTKSQESGIDVNADARGTVDGNMLVNDGEVAPDDIQIDLDDLPRA